jgi:hypothetical protein
LSSPVAIEYWGQLQAAGVDFKHDVLIFFILLACLLFLGQLTEFGVPKLDVLRQRHTDL